MMECCTEYWHQIGWEAGVQYNAFYYPDGNERVNDPNASADAHYGLNMSNVTDPLGGCVMECERKSFLHRRF